MAKLITTTSYFNLFPILTKELKDCANSLNGKNLVFCEEKVSLMAERIICAEFKGSFNTDVYSFGNYLRVKKPMDRLLSKEGSAMAVKRILGKINLKCFRSSKNNLAPALFELIIQLKSAKVTPKDLTNAIENSHGILKNKLIDICAVYTEYENFIKDNGYEDQSSMLSYLPSLIENSEEIKGANVYIVGFSGWTSQIRHAIKTLLKTAKSVTAILTYGENDMIYVNETATTFDKMCQELNVPLTKETAFGGMTEEGVIIANNLFNPSASGVVNKKTEKMFYGVFSTPYDEIERVGEVIKRLVLNGEFRYRDVTVALSDLSIYRDDIKSVFSALEIPYFLDEQKNVLSHPFITLILSYAEVFRKGFHRDAVLSFLKNPLFSDDKSLLDTFENYLIIYNINYGRIKEPFTFLSIENRELSELEQLRLKLMESFSAFNVRKLISNLNVKEKLSVLSNALKDAGEIEESAINEQIFDAVMKILTEMEMMLGDTELSITEYVHVFLSGVQALELSIIPQYNDAVFIGNFKETALAKTECLFVVGLTSSVPNVKADVALLSDSDIDALEDIKLLVEPKIRVVNHRTRENVGMALSAFNKRIYLSYPSATVDGKKNGKSEILPAIFKLFDLLPYTNGNGYVTKKQGASTFAREIGEFAERKTDDISNACAYFKVVGEETLKPLLDNANKEIKERLDGNRSALIGGETAPTVIEDYYKCPYRAFISHVLKLRDREEGVVNALSVGNFMHEILKKFIDRIGEAFDLESLSALFDNVKDEVLKMPIYARYYADKTTSTTMNRVIEECKGYCFNTYQYLKKSKFTEIRTELAFGDGEKYSSIPLLGGKVRLSGKIDRVDLSDKYFRVVDYKTGSTDTSDESLFTGNKLQLYLYAMAVKNKFEKEKDVVGLYYLPISDKYEKEEDKSASLAVGKTLDDKDAICSQDSEFFLSGQSEFLPAKIDQRNGKVKNCANKDVLSGYMDYAIAISEKAVERMEQGVIKPSPYKGVCEYCKFGALCGVNELAERNVNKVTERTITEALNKGDEKDATY
ncbi:MAG: PD-(D/E)XK nuclease family protein [Clostridia bacterium]|nr:PD-(D/E)XK nuclease family protein [Clostridia bacterium]